MLAFVKRVIIRLFNSFKYL